MTAAFKRYFRAHLRASFRPLLYITAVVLVVTLLTALTGQIEVREYADPPRTDYYSNLGSPVWLLVLLCCAAPVMEFAVFKRRTNLDCLYSMPLSRRELGAVHYLTGAIIVAVPYTLSYLLNALLLLRAPQEYDVAPLVGRYFLSLLFGLCVYSLFVFLMDRANALGDGIAFMALYSFVIFAIAGALYAVLPSRFLGSFNDFLGGVIWDVLLMMTIYYGASVERATSEFHSSSFFWREADIVFWFIFWTVLGVAAAVGFFLLFGKKRTEKTGELSDTFFGYRVLIPLLAACGMIALNTVVGWITFEILAFIGYTVYRRGFHYKKSDIIVLVSLAVLLLCCV